MTDERTVVLTLRASTALEGDFGPIWPALILRCREGAVEAYVSVSMVLDGAISGGSQVRLRWNEESPVSAMWSRSSDYQAVFADEPATFIAALLRASRFRIEVRPYDKAPIVASFTPRGLRPLIPRLVAACPEAGLDSALSAPGSRPSNAAVAQRNAATDQVFFEFQVEKQVAPLPGSPSLRYPDMLRAANVEGEVLAQFVVDTAGRVDMTSIKILKSSHDLFTQAVREHLSAAKYYPAELSGRKVKQLVQQPFNFTLTR